MIREIIIFWLPAINVEWWENANHPTTASPEPASHPLIRLLALIVLGGGDRGVLLLQGIRCDLCPLSQLPTSAGSKGLRGGWLGDILVYTAHIFWEVLSSRHGWFDAFVCQASIHNIGCIKNPIIKLQKLGKMKVVTAYWLIDRWPAEYTNYTRDHQSEVTVPAACRRWTRISSRHFYSDCMARIHFCLAFRLTLYYELNMLFYSKLKFYFCYSIHFAYLNGSAFL